MEVLIFILYFTMCLSGESFAKIHFHAEISKSSSFSVELFIYNKIKLICFQCVTAITLNQASKQQYLYLLSFSIQGLIRLKDGAHYSGTWCPISMKFYIGGSFLVSLVEIQCLRPSDFYNNHFLKPAIWAKETQHCLPIVTSWKA